MSHRPATQEACKLTQPPEVTLGTKSRSRGRLRDGGKPSKGTRKDKRIKKNKKRGY